MLIKPSGTITSLVFCLLITIQMALPLNNLEILPQTETVRGSEFTVDVDGSAEYFSIQDAIDASSDGDTIYISPGTYNETLNITRPIHLVGSGSNTTEIIGNWGGGVINIQSDNVSISDVGVSYRSNMVYPIMGASVKITGSDNFTLRSVNLSRGMFGLEILDSSNGTVENSTFTLNARGILINGNSTFNFLRNSTFQNEAGDIELAEGSDNNSIQDNRLFGNGMTIYSSNNNVWNNTFGSISELFYQWRWRHIESNLVLDNAKYNTMTGNNFSYGNVYFGGEELSHYLSNKFSGGNLIDGHPLKIWKNVDGGKIENDVGQVILINCTGVTVESIRHSTQFQVHLAYSKNNTIKSNSAHIILVRSSNNVIDNNICEGDGHGIRIFKSHNNSIQHNTINNQKTEYGISLGSSHDNTIINNTVTDSSWAGIKLMRSDRNAILHNDCNNNSAYGIIAGYSDNLTIAGNTCNFNGPHSAGSVESGIRVHHSEGPLIIGNICISNSDYGISVDSATQAIINQNQCYSNGMNGIELFDLRDSILDHNSCARNGNNGINFRGRVSFIQVSNNLLHTNMNGGITAYYNSINNTLFNNMFLGHRSHVQTSTENDWSFNNITGNYWSDYFGEDNGANGRTPGDGVGDTFIPFHGIDHNPLMNIPGNVGPMITLGWPEDGLVVNVTQMELSWQIEMHDEILVAYSVYIYSPQLNWLKTFTNIQEPAVLVDGLKLGNTYHWTVIPITTTGTGLCVSGVRTFTITDEDIDYGVEITAPDLIRLYPGESTYLDLSLTNNGTAMDLFIIDIVPDGESGIIKLSWNEKKMVMDIRTRVLDVLVSLDDRALPGNISLSINARSNNAEVNGQNASDEAIVVIQILEREFDDNITEGGDDDNPQKTVPITDDEISYLTVGIIIVLVVLTATYTVWSPVLYFTISPLILRADRRAEHRKWMTRVYGSILSQPGIHFNGIKAWLDIPNGSLVYNLKELMRKEKIVARRDGLYKRFYPTISESGAPPPEGLDFDEKIVLLVRDNPGITQTELAFLLNESKQRVHYQVRRMVGGGVLRIDKNSEMMKGIYLTDDKRSKDKVGHILEKEVKAQ